MYQHDSSCLDDAAALGVIHPDTDQQELEEQLKQQRDEGVDLRADKARLQEHIADLESRKRAPLYQKKQEEELKAAVDKAQEAELRASEAELRAKQAKV